MTLDPSSPLSDAIPTSLRVDVTQASAGHEAGIANEGYWGIPIRRNARYRVSFFAKASAAVSGSIVVSLQTPDGATKYASASIQGPTSTLTTAWKRFEVTLVPETIVTPTANAS